MKLIKNKSLITACFILSFVLLIYIISAGRFKFIFPTEPANYFSHLSVSFLNGRLNLINPSWSHDLSLYNHKLFMYWGPTPVLLILPLVLFFGVNISDVLYTAIFASFSPLIIYLSLKKLEEFQLIRLSNLKKIILSLFFAFGTVYFSIAVRGSVWFTSQAISTLYILLALYFIFSYSVSRRLFQLILSSFFLGLAGWGRSTFFFYTPLFLALIYIIDIKKPNIKLFIRKTIPFILVLITILIMIGIFNYLRFGSIIENGLEYVNLAPRFVMAKIQYGYFNTAYVEHNLHYNYLNLPSFSIKSPYIIFDPEGNSFLFLSPLFLLLPLIFRKKYWKNLNLTIFNGTTILCTLILICLQLGFWGTGWVQFSARYLLDIIPLLILLLAQIIEDTSLAIIILLVAISIVFNTIGALWLIGVLS